MPWEDTEDFIRSGHRNPEEFEPDSLKTITLSEEEGIKAVIGKPKGKKTTEVVSYLFSKERGWTLEKAKHWFSEHQAKAKESFSWAGSIKELPGAPNLIRGKALHPLRTVHPEEWPEVREYLEEELQKSAHSLGGKPLILDHYQPLRGKVLGAEYEDGAIEYVAKIDDPQIWNLIKKGDIKHCSVEFNWKTLENVNGVAPRGIIFSGLSLLKNFEPGDPLATVEVWEAILKQLKEANGSPTIDELIESIGNAIAEINKAFDALKARVKVPDSGRTATEQQGNQEPEKDEHGCIIGKERYDETQDKCVPIKTAKEQQGGGETPKAGEPKTNRQRFMAHFGIDEEAFRKFYDLLGDELFKLLPERGTKTAKEQGNGENGERQKLRQAQKERAKKYGISPKEGGHLTKPSEYEDVPEDKFADPVNFRYPVTEKYVKGALTYFNQPDNREAGGYTHEEAVKIMTTIVKAALNAGIEVSWQPEDPVYRDLPKELKKKLTGYEEPSQTASEQQGNQEPEKDEHGCVIGKEKWDPDQEKCVAVAAEARIAFLETVLRLKEQQDELTVEEIKQKIVDLTKRQEELRNKLYPEAELSEEEKTAIQAEIDALYAEIQGYEQALAAEIAGQAATTPVETPTKPETAGEAIIPSGTEQPILCVVPVEKLESILPSLQAERSMSYGSQRFVQDVKRLIREAKEHD